MENDTGQEGQPADASMTKKPQNRRFKDTARRLRQGKDAHLSHRASLDWRHDGEAVCAPGERTEDHADISALLETLRKSRTAAALLDAEDAPEISYDPQHAGAQYYPREGARPLITLNPYRTRGDLLGLLTRELRRVWQHRNGALVNPLLFEPDEAILVNRAQAADAFMMTVKVAWELKLAGEQEAWNHICGSPMADIGRSFEIRAQADFRTLNNGAAARCAYDKFFEDSRTKLHDKSIIHQMLLDENGYLKTASARPRVSQDLFRRLGEMPGGANYFSGRSGRAPTDASYATVEDRSNANFLWFIKFERSFQEREMQLVQESVKLSAEIVDFARWSLQHGKTDA
jgi:hypothetical protein